MDHGHQVKVPNEEHQSFHGKDIDGDQARVLHDHQEHDEPQGIVENEHIV